MGQTLLERFQCVREHDTEKIILMEDLLAENKVLKTQLRETQLHLERIEAESTGKTGRMESNPFVSVLIDGDSMNFNDELLKTGEVGGRKAAYDLRSVVKNYLQGEHPDLQHDIHILIRVYANFRGLAGTYLDIGTISHPTQFQDFTRGFNMADPFSDFIDAGNGKACADEKLKELFKVHLHDVHCKKILFGGSSDNDYARMFIPYSDDEVVSQRIILLEGPPFAYELEQIKKNFHHVRLNGVFRTEKLPQKRKHMVSDLPSSKTQLIKTGNPPSPPNSAGMQLNNRRLIEDAQHTQPAASDPRLAPQPSASQSYISPVTTSSWTQSITTDPRLATAGPPSGALPKNNPATHLLPAKVIASANPSNIIVNSKGQRIDQIIDADFALVKTLITSKLCTRFYLRGFCPYGDKCTFIHGPPLQEHELLALLLASRRMVCDFGSACRDDKCMFGHQCFRPNCQRDLCKFPSEMHDVVRD